jgi:hypothetical protein
VQGSILGLLQVFNAAVGIVNDYISSGKKTVKKIAAAADGNAAKQADSNK